MNESINILLVDDEPNSTRLLKKVLVKSGYSVDEENDSITALKKMQQENYDIVVSDLHMPNMTGMDLLKAKPEGLIFIMITGFGSIDSAVESMKIGAYDYINKPFNIEEFSIKISKAAEKVRLKNQVKKLREQISENTAFYNIIGKSKKIQIVIDLIKKYSQSNANVFIEGQSGTGKELVSRAIHLNSGRKKFPFIAINCSAIPESLLENELFGHVKGAYTGAVYTQRGVFEEANNGTILLDEIAEMPFILQSKLLRVIENFEVKAVGSDKIKRVNVRILSATNQNIKELVKQKKFREDLYYRIATTTISIPPLDERKDDIPVLVEHFLKKYSINYDKEFSITSDAMELLIKYSWKGNVRELENCLERAAISSDSEKLDVNSFRFLNDSDVSENPLSAIENLSLREMEKFYILKTLDDYKWNKLQVAKVLGIDRKTLYKKIKDFNLE